MENLRIPEAKTEAGTFLPDDLQKKPILPISRPVRQFLFKLLSVIADPSFWYILSLIFLCLSLSPQLSLIWFPWIPQARVWFPSLIGPPSLSILQNSPPGTPAPPHQWCKLSAYQGQTQAPSWEGGSKGRETGQQQNSHLFFTFWYVSTK